MDTTTKGIQKQILLAVALTAGFTLTLTNALQASDPGRRYLAVDQSLHAPGTTLNMVMGQATDQQLVLMLEGQRDDWEQYNDFGLSSYTGSIIEDHEGKYRMYYRVVRPTGWSLEQYRTGEISITWAMAMAVSEDGINWSKPALNVAPHLLKPGTPNWQQSNLIFLQPHPDMTDGKWYSSDGVYYDADASKEERYQLMWSRGHNVYVATSPDGLSFITRALVFNHKADTKHTFFYDSTRDEYVIYGRKRGPRDWGFPGHPYEHRRGIAFHSSPNWTDSPWRTVGVVAADPLNKWDWGEYEPGDGRIRPDLYTPAVQSYYGQYIGMPGIYFQDESRQPVPRPDYHLGTGPIYPVLMHSNDGINWTFPHPYHPIIELEPHERISYHPEASYDGLEVGRIFVSNNFLEIDNQLLIYYANHTANEAEIHEDDRTRVHVAFLRVDGFASLRSAENQAGEWRTPDISVPVKARGLLVNANVTGSLRAEVVDAETGAPVPGLSLDNSVIFTGDDTGAYMKWKNAGIEDVAGQDIQLRFEIEDGEIFSFSFTSIP